MNRPHSPFRCLVVLIVIVSRILSGVEAKPVEAKPAKFSASPVPQLVAAVFVRVASCLARDICSLVVR
jgi:hypothetical protein